MEAKILSYIFAVLERSARDLFANVKQISLADDVNDDAMNVIQIPAKIEGNAYSALNVLVCILRPFYLKIENLINNPVDAFDYSYIY